MPKPSKGSGRRRPKATQSAGLGLIPRIVFFFGGLVGGLSIVVALFLAAAAEDYVESAGRSGAKHAVANARGVRSLDNVHLEEKVASGGTGRTLEFTTQGGTTPDASPVTVPANAFAGYADSARAAILVALISLAVLSFALAYFVAVRVVAPLNRIVDDVTEISRGKLGHRIHVGGGGEIATLGRAVTRMVDDLLEKSATDEELDRREHDVSVAAEIRQALIPDSIPQLKGYEIAGSDLSGAETGGDFFDVLEFPSGRLGLLVCEIAGSGVSSSMIMTMARAYLRAEALRVEEPTVALGQANRLIRRDIRRGMYVTAQYALLDPERGELRVASAGHKVPLLRWSAEKTRLQMLQSEGIALGLDAGPVFDKTIREVKVQLQPGDRVVMTTTGGSSVKDAAGEEIGEKGFYRIISQYAARDADAFLDGLLNEISEYAEGSSQERNLILLTCRRNPEQS